MLVFPFRKKAVVSVLFLAILYTVNTNTQYTVFGLCINLIINIFRKVRHKYLEGALLFGQQ